MYLDCCYFSCHISHLGLLIYYYYFIFYTNNTLIFITLMNPFIYYNNICINKDTIFYDLIISLFFKWVLLTDVFFIFWPYINKICYYTEYPYKWLLKNYRITFIVKTSFWCNFKSELWKKKAPYTNCNKQSSKKHQTLINLKWTF